MKSDMTTGLSATGACEALVEGGSVLGTMELHVSDEVWQTNIVEALASQKERSQTCLLRRSQIVSNVIKDVQVQVYQMHRDRGFRTRGNSVVVFAGATWALNTYPPLVHTYASTRI